MARATTANPSIGSGRSLGSNAVLTGAVVVSFALHAWLILPGVIGVATHDRPPRAVEQTAYERSEPDRPSPADVMLGREDSDASTLTWIGYEEYEEHLARLAEVEQAAMTREQPGAAVEPGDGAPADVPPLEVEPSAETAAETTDDMPVVDTDPLETPTQPEAIEPGPAADEVEFGPSDAEQPGPVDPAVVAESLRRARALADRMRDAIEVMRDASDDLLASVPEFGGAAGPAQASDAEPAERPDDDQPADAPGQDGRQAGGEPGESGEPGDYESDPTSTIDVPLDDLRAGRPVAGEGIELQTRRPKFTNLQRLTARPINPVLAIDFSSQGVPRDVRIKRSSTYRSVDEAIVNSLYQWRARGEQIDKLENDQTLEIVIEVILIGR